MEERFYNRYQSWCRSLENLTEAKLRDMSDSFVLSGTGAKFSITFDLAWKVMKDILIQKYAVIDFPKGSPREVLRKSYEMGMISDDRWMDMLSNRNDLAHDYDGVLLTEICEKIVTVYIDLFDQFREWVEKNCR